MEEDMGLIAWIVFGLIAGAVARLIFPGRQPGGLLITIVLGIAGAVAGGLIASAAGAGGVTGFNLWSLLVAIGGALLLLVVYELLAGRSGARGHA
jgi:uncharacterized membrane protein YeaQ/YmgE (transglycosylase-associated protein family)